MGKKDNDALRQKKNERFIRAFNYVATARNMNQGELATAIGSKSAYISGYKSGIRPVTDEVIEGLVRESCVEPSQKIYREYLLGNSDIMLLANVTEEELTEVEFRRNNPDYDTIQQRLRDSERNLDTQLSQSLPPASVIDPASEHNAAISAYVQLANRLTDDLKRKDQEMADRLVDKDARITDLLAHIREKEDHIATLQSRIADLERQNASLRSLDPTTYPFPIGAAENRNNQNVSPKI